MCEDAISSRQKKTAYSADRVKLGTKEFENRYSCSKYENVDKLCFLLSCWSYKWPIIEEFLFLTYDDIARVPQITPDP